MNPGPTTALSLPAAIAEACAPLFAAVPFESAMPHLEGSHPHHKELVDDTLRASSLKDRPDIAAGLWLYVDDLERCHAICQDLPDPTGAYWHGIMHRREGDYSNSHYWMRRAEGHPLLQLHPELDPHGLVDAVSSGSNNPDLIERQRQEWKALFEWCASHP
jgi:hypothetical protein